MREINSDIIEKLSTLSEREILEETTDGRIFHVLSPDRADVAEWFPFRKNDEVCCLGGSLSSLCVISERVSRFLVVTGKKSEQKLIAARFPRLCEAGNLTVTEELPSGTFDVVIDTEGAREKAFGLLKPGGTYLSFAQNRGSMLLLTGGEMSGEGASLSYEEVEHLLSDARFSQRKLYFPLPNLTHAKNIKSMELPPEPGDFRGISESFTEDRFALCNDEAIFDSLSKGGPLLFARYAPSYLLVLTGYQKENDRALPDYIRYNRTRKPEYRLRTELTRGKACVKTALSPEGDAHIASFAEKYELLKKTCPAGLSVSEPRIFTDESGRTAAEFSFIEGKSLGKILSEQISGGRAPEEEIRRLLDFLIPKECHNLDMLFDNVLTDGENYTLIDYEWVFPEVLSPSFVRYRVLRYFYEDNHESLSAYRDLNEFLTALGVNKKDLASFEVKEADFQLLVHGSDKGSFEDKFRKPQMNASQISEMAKKLSRTERLEDEVSELKTTLMKEREVERLSQQHIRNIEQINKVREAELAAQKAELSYLRDHEALLSRTKRKMIGKIDAWAPADSARRMTIKYVKGTLLHPGTYLGRYFTAEGKLLKRGDFEIGGEFPEGGILTVPETETPLVSIIIPAYNQVRYTYACIRSILLHTSFTETPYEIILADDASNDATKEIGTFIQNLRIARTAGNLGFLRNCNNAAEPARGTYLFFLNNDTKVTDGWLSSLIRVMEQDPSVGLCGSKLVYPDGRLQEAGGIIWSDASGWNYGRLDDPEKPEYNYVKEADYISGAAILIRHGLWKEIGGFDERYAPAYCEDSDLAFEVRRHGKKVVYQPDSVVIHFEGISNGTDVNGTGLKRYQVINLEKFREKWADELKNQSVNDGNPNPFQARDRSQQKKTILVVDHYVPQRDKDAGSKTTFQYLRLFVEKGYSVKFLPDNFESEEPYSHELRQMGIEILSGEEMRQGIFAWIEKNKDMIEFAYLNRPHIAIKYIDYLKQNTKIRCIFYGHDLHYLRLRREFELTGDIRKRRESDYWKSVEYQVMEQADMVYYPSQDEIDEIREERPDIRAKAITAYIYDREETPSDPPCDEAYEKRQDLLFVGGFRHPPNEDGVLWFVKDIWPAVHAALPEARFLVAGSHPTSSLEEQNGKDGVEVLGFVSDERLSELYRTCRLVVVPLRYGAGVKGKVIEALNEATAIVTTKVGAEGIPEAGTVLRIADRAEEFANAVTELYRDPETLSKMRRACGPFIGKYYSTEAVWKTVAEDFE